MSIQPPYSQEPFPCRKRLLLRIQMLFCPFIDDVLAMIADAPDEIPLRKQRPTVYANAAHRDVLAHSRLVVTGDIDDGNAAASATLSATFFDIL